MRLTMVREWLMREREGWRAVVMWLGQMIGFGVVWTGVYYALMVWVSGLVAGAWFVVMAGVFAHLFLADGCGMARWQDTRHTTAADHVG